MAVGDGLWDEADRQIWYRKGDLNSSCGGVETTKERKYKVY